MWYALNSQCVPNSVFQNVKFIFPYSFSVKNNLDMDTVINIIPNADISKTRKITFFSIIYIKNINFCIPKFCQDILVWYGTIQYKKWSFLGEMAGKDGKVTFCYISISYLKIEIRQVLRPSQRAGLICFYHGNR